MSEPVLIVIPTYVTSDEQVQVVKKTITSLDRWTSLDDYELLVVDDGSPLEIWGDLAESLAEQHYGEFYGKSDNTGFADTVNVGLRKALDEGRDAVLCNADIEFFEPWLHKMRATAYSSDLHAVVGAQLFFPNGLIQHAGIYFSVIYRHFDHIYRFAPGNLPAAQRSRRCPVTAALQYIRHDCLETVGIYDNKFKLGYEDVDYCHRVFMSGRECWYEPQVRAAHYESMFRGNVDPESKLAQWQAESWAYLHEKYKGHSFAEYIPTLLWDDEEETVQDV